MTGPRDQETKRTEGGEGKKVWEREVLYWLHLMSGALIKHSMLHSVSRVSRINHTVQQSQQELNQAQCCTREAKGILRILQNKYMPALGLIATAPYGGKSGGLRI